MSTLDNIKERQVNKHIETPGGYLYEEPQIAGQPRVTIDLAYEDAYDIILDGIQNAASIEPITEPTFKLLAANLLALLVDGDS